MSELRHADDWPLAALREIAAVEAWLRQTPASSALELRLKALLAAIS